MYEYISIQKKIIIFKTGHTNIVRTIAICKGMSSYNIDSTLCFSNQIEVWSP